MASIPRPMTISGRNGGARFLRNQRVATGGLFATDGGTVGARGGVAASDPYRGESMSFPNDLSVHGNHIKLEAFETKGLGGDLLGSALGAVGNFLGVSTSGFNYSTKIDGATIRLPLPVNLRAEYSPEYTAPDLGMGGLGIKAAEKYMYRGGTPNAAAIQDIVAKGAGGLSASLTSTAVSGLLSKIGITNAGTGTAALLKVGLGAAINQHKILLFTGVDFRVHNFTWRLSPRNNDESNKIDRIIKALTYYSHPAILMGGFAFKYPEFFKISFHRDAYLYKFIPAVITALEVDYQPQGYAYKRADSSQPAPAEVVITASFKEVEIITKESYNQIFNTSRTPAGGTIESFPATPSTPAEVLGGRRRDRTTGDTVPGGPQA